MTSTRKKTKAAGDKQSYRVHLRQTTTATAVVDVEAYSVDGAIELALAKVDGDELGHDVEWDFDDGDIDVDQVDGP